MRDEYKVCWLLVIATAFFCALVPAPSTVARHARATREAAAAADRLAAQVQLLRRAVDRPGGSHSAAVFAMERRLWEVSGRIHELEKQTGAAEALEQKCAAQRKVIEDLQSHVEDLEQVIGALLPPVP